MRPVHESLRRVQKNQISRRDFMKQLAALGISTPLIAGYLAGCAPETSSEGGGEAAQLSELTKAQAVADPLIMNGWSYLPEVVQQFQETFSQQYDESARFEVIPGDYPATMLNKMIANVPVDVMYSKLEAAKFFDAGWIIPFESLPNYDVEQVKQDMWPALLEILTYRDQLIGLPYYSSVKNMVWYNKILLDQVGVGESDLPATWDELYNLCADLKADGGVEIPIVMHWYPNANGIVHNWLSEALNRGDEVGDQNNAVFDASSGAAETLEAWRRLYAEELVPADSLVLGSSDAQDIFMTGRAAFIVNQSYQGKVFNTPDRSNVAGNAYPLPRVEQPWGLFDYGGYGVISNPDDPLKQERAKRLAEFMGYKDANGEFLVGKEWTLQAYLSPAYPQVNQDPEVIAANKAWMPAYPHVDNVVQDLLENTTAPKVWKALWYPEWSTHLAIALPDAVNGTRTVTEVIEDVRTKWDELAAPYAG